MENSRKLYRKLRALAIERWGVLPRTFDKACAAKEIRITDVLDCMNLAIAQSLIPDALLQFLFPQTMEAKRQAEIDQENAAAWEAFQLDAQRKKQAGNE